jgi:hypothetical protein
MENIKNRIKIRKISLVLMVVILLSFMTACSSSSSSDTDGVKAPDGMVGVTNDAIHFSVCYPQNWICDRNDGMITVSPPADSGSKASVSIHESTALAEEITAADYWEKSKVELESSGTKCNFLESKEMTLADTPAIRAVYGIVVGENTYKVTQIFAYKYIDSTHRMFTITFTGTEEDYGNSKVYESFNSIVNCFEFK